MVVNVAKCGDRGGYGIIIIIGYKPADYTILGNIVVAYSESLRSSPSSILDRRYAPLPFQIFAAGLKSGPKHVREHKASLPSATNRLHNVVAAPHHPLPGLHQPRHRPGHPHPTPTTSPACSGRQRCSSWTSTPTVSSSSSKSCRRECKHCSCHITTLCEHMQASACAEQRHVRWGGCVHEHAKKRGVPATPRIVAQIATPLSLIAPPSNAASRHLPERRVMSACAQAQACRTSRCACRPQAGRGFWAAGARMRQVRGGASWRAYLH